MKEEQMKEEEKEDMNYLVIWYAIKYLVDFCGIVNWNGYGMRIDDAVGIQSRLESVGGKLVKLKHYLKSHICYSNNFNKT